MSKPISTYGRLYSTRNEGVTSKPRLNADMIRRLYEVRNDAAFGGVDPALIPHIDALKLYLESWVIPQLDDILNYIEGKPTD